MRRLPIYLLIDTSGSMRGEPIESVKIGLESMLATLKNDAFMSQIAWLSIITFDKNVENILPLTYVKNVFIPNLQPPLSGPTFLGKALELLISKIDQEVKKKTTLDDGDYPPLLLVMTDGKPSDLYLYEQMADRLRKRKFSKIIACAAGPSGKEEPLRLITNNVVNMSTLDSFSFVKLFDMVCSHFDTEVEYDQTKLEDLPKEIMI